MKMKKYSTYFLVLFAAVTTFFVSCKSPTTTLLGDWSQRAVYAGLARNGAVVFVIGNQAFVGTGYNKDNNQWRRDFWVYDAVKDNWTQIAPLPALGRVNAVAFSAGGKGYVGTGYSNEGGVNKQLTDFYSYDPTNNAWTKVSDLPGPSRTGAVAFAVNNTGYVGTGVSRDTTGVTNGLGDFYAFSPASNTWKAVSGYPGAKVNGAFSFVINNLAYVGGGQSSNGVDNGLYLYNPNADRWYKKARLDSNINSVPRSFAVSFALNGTGYIATGTNGQGTSCYAYNPGNDTWTQKTSVETNIGRSEGVGFALTTGLPNGYSAFLGLGTPGASSSPQYDWWAFNPDAAKIDNN